MHKKCADGVGVDRLAVTFPVSSAPTFDSGAWDSASTRKDGRTTVARTVELQEGNVVRVSVMDVAAEKWGRVEGNPSRFLDPDGCSLAPLGSLSSVARSMVAIADETSSRTADLGECRITRVDLARDFREVERPGFFIRGLQAVKRPYARLSAVYADPSLGGAQTLVVGGKQSKVRLYDQHEAYAERGAPEGSMRFEVQGRKGWLERYGNLQRLRDWDAETAEDFLRERWEWSGMDVEVAAVDRVVERVRRSGLSASEQCTVLGLLLMRATESPVELHRNSRGKYDRIIRDLGVVLTPGDLAGEGSPFVARLDFDSGREVLQSAA